MNLRKKKELASRTLGLGKSQIVFLESRKDEIKEAITKQDIKELKKDGAIIIKEMKGRKKKKKVKVKQRGTGKIRKKVNTRKKDYVILTRRLRSIVAEMKKQKRLTQEDATEIRKKIRNKKFKSKAHLGEHIGGLEK